jgi:hypothetical protein
MYNDQPTSRRASGRLGMLQKNILGLASIVRIEWGKDSGAEVKDG